MGENINLMSNSKFHKKVGEVWHYCFKLMINLLKKTIFTPKVGHFYKCLSLTDPATWNPGVHLLFGHFLNGFRKTFGIKMRW
jgi:hypothetical protein